MSAAGHYQPLSIHLPNARLLRVKRSLGGAQPFGAHVYNREMVRLAIVLILLSTVSLGEEPPRYPIQYALEEGELLVPSEFQDGVASGDQVIAWAESLILHIPPQRDELDVLRVDYDRDGRSEIAIGIPTTYGSDGGIYLYFDATESGYRYLGQVPNPDKRYFHCYSENQGCYAIDRAGFPGEAFLSLYKVGPSEISWLARFRVLYDDYETVEPLLEFPKTEEMLLDRFESRAK